MNTSKRLNESLELEQKMSDLTAPYDALLVVSYGGPNGPDDVLPFMRNATKGKGIPDERLLEVSGHYGRFGGVSPINVCNESLLEALREELRSRGADIAIGLGNRNWHPFMSETTAELAQGGARRILMMQTSAYASYSGCRQYREDVADALALLPDGGKDMTVDKVRSYHDSPGFLTAQIDVVSESVKTLLDRGTAIDDLHLVFVTHSIPTQMQGGSGNPDKPGSDYAAQHLALMELIVPAVEEKLGLEAGTLKNDLAFCSRSGNPNASWLEPDINDRLEELKSEGIKAVSCAPIGFISDHMEVVFDLDTEAKQTAADLELDYDRAHTVDTHPAFIASLVDLILERAARARGENPEQPSTLPLGAWPDECTSHCCRMIEGLDTGKTVVAGPTAAKNGELPTHARPRGAHHPTEPAPEKPRE